MTGKQLAAVSLLTVAAAAGSAVLTGCTAAELGDVKAGRAQYDPTSMEYKDVYSHPIAETDLPQDIRDQIRQQFPRGKIIGVEERKYRGGQLYYRVHVGTGEGPDQVQKTMDYNSGAGR